MRKEVGLFRAKLRYRRVLRRERGVLLCNGGENGQKWPKWGRFWGAWMRGEETRETDEE